MPGLAWDESLSSEKLGLFFKGGIGVGWGVSFLFFLVGWRKLFHLRHVHPSTQPSPVAHTQGSWSPLPHETNQRKLLALYGIGLWNSPLHDAARVSKNNGETN